MFTYYKKTPVTLKATAWTCQIELNNGSKDVVVFSDGFRVNEEDGTFYLWWTAAKSYHMAINGEGYAIWANNLGHPIPLTAIKTFSRPEVSVIDETMVLLEKKFLGFTIGYGCSFPSH